MMNEDGRQGPCALPLQYQSTWNVRRTRHTVSAASLVIQGRGYVRYQMHVNRRFAGRSGYPNIVHHDFDWSTSASRFLGSPCGVSSYCHIQKDDENCQTSRPNHVVDAGRCMRNTSQGVSQNWCIIFCKDSKRSLDV